MDDDNGHKLTIEQMAENKMLDHALEGTIKANLRSGSTFKGTTVSLGELMRQDGIIAEGIDKLGARSMGVIQTLITAEEDDRNYRQILKRARWKNQEHRDKFVKALAVCRITGARMAAQTLLDQVTADSAGDNAVWAHEAIEGLTHTTFTTHSQMDKKKYDNNRSRSNSPIA